ELRPINDDEICTMRDGKLIAIAAGAERALWVLDPDRSVAVRWVSEYGDLSPWETLAFERYNDMRDLLLFAPIHEVQVGGWPAVAPEPG
ncbi:MAG: hypothetical protein ACI8RE_003442, partial [Ilumatobacter sp.]